MDCKMNELHLDGKLCDVVLRVDDVEFDAHKIMLRICSSYFEALFSERWAAPETHVFNISGLSPNMMRLIIDYAYTRSVPVTEENVEELLAAADQFCVMGVVHACCDFLEQKFCPKNCIKIWNFTDVYYYPHLRRKVYRFMLHHFENIVWASEEFLELSLQQLTDIIERDDLNVKQESRVFEAVLRWITHMPEERRDHISVLLSKVRLGLMSADYFINTVKNNALVKDSRECRPIIINAMGSILGFIANRPYNSYFHDLQTRPRLPSAVLLAIGGWTRGGPTNGLQAYDANTDRWLNVTNDQESPLAYHGIAYLDGSVYFIGGFDRIDHINSVRKYDLVTRAWHQVAPMHSCRRYISVVVMNGCIYAMGGLDRQLRLNTVERYEPETDQWTMLAPMCEARSNASATALHGKVYICGGFNGIKSLSTAECYNPETNQWRLIAAMRSERSGVGVFAYGEHVYAVGGFHDTNLMQSAEAYNPLTDTWCAVPFMLHSHCSFGIRVVDDRLFLVGKGGIYSVTTAFNVESYDESTGEWCENRKMEVIQSMFNA